MKDDDFLEGFRAKSREADELFELGWSIRKAAFRLDHHDDEEDRKRLMAHASRVLGVAQEMKNAIPIPESIRMAKG